MTNSNAGRTKYNELSKAKATETRNVVISECSRGGFTIAQQLEAQEATGTTTVFMKNAIQVDSLSRLIDVRNAINVAIQIATDKEKDAFKDADEDEDWE